MNTYSETDLENGTETESAIARSISHDEIVCIECESPEMLMDWINDNYDAVDHAREPDGSWDVWGERDGESFRVRLVNMH